MATTPRNIRFDDDLYKEIMSLAKYPLSGAYHIQEACKQYLANFDRPVAKPIAKPKAKGISPTPIKGGWVKLDLEFEDIWAIYEKKGNRKTAKARYIKLSESDRDAIFKHAPLYVLSTPDKKYRKGFEVYINLECWNDEVTPNGNQDKSGRPATTGRLTPAQRTKAAGERWEASQESNVPVMGGHAGNIRPSVQQPIRGGTDRFVGETIDGDYTSAD